MDKTKVLHEVRLMRFDDIYQRRRNGNLTTTEAAEILGVDERTVRRWSSRYDEYGSNGLIDKRLGKISNRRAPVHEALEMISLFETYYYDFTVKHFFKKFKEIHGCKRSYTWVKNQLQKAGKVKKAVKKGVHRRKRPRKPLPGIMLHQDGSTHEWVLGKQWDLIVTLDDATSEIYSAFFVEEEGTISTMMALYEVISNKGLFCSLYADRGSHYWFTPKAGGKVDKNNLTQVHRALRQLNIELIPAYSPEARGRSERMFRTLQERLPKELRLSGIQDKEAANKYLKELFIKEFNTEFMVVAEEPGNAFIPWLGDSNKLSDILCVQEERVVAKDNTVHYYNKILQIPADQYRYHYIKATVKVHEYPDGHLAIFHGHRCLAKYTTTGSIIPEPNINKLRSAELISA